MTRQHVLRSALACFFITAIASSGSAHAATEFIAETKMSDVQREVVSESGLVLIETVSDTRAEIRARDYIRAQREVRKARRLCRHIAEASPPLSLKNSVAAVASSLDSGTATPTEHLAPIYQRLDVYRKVTDAEEVQAHVDQARGELEAGNVELAVAHLEEATTVISFFEIDLPIDETCKLLTMANDDFERGDPRMADTRLQKIQGSLKSFAAVAKIEVDDAEFEHIDVAAPPE